MTDKALSPLRRKDIETGRKLEREAIVSFLREQDHEAFSQWIESETKKYNNNLARIASQIENGEHLK